VDEELANPNNLTSTQAQRCQGLEQAIDENSFVQYKGGVAVPPMNTTGTDDPVLSADDIQQLLETQLGIGDWQGVGLLRSTTSTEKQWPLL
jgi:hypothetical protein